MKVAFYTRIVKEESKDSIRKLLHSFQGECRPLFLFPLLYDYFGQELEGAVRIGEESLKEGMIDYCISLGGDGSFLDAATQVAHLSIPLIGINFGRLGFLTDVSVQDGSLILDHLRKNQFKIERRTMLRIGHEGNINYFGKQQFAINEITLSKRDISTLISLEMYIDGKYTYTYWADGIIVSTPTGSTGYNLSCNGPIVFPSTNCFIITPYASHNLNVRPLVISDDVKIAFHISCRTSDSFICTLDSRRKELPTSSAIYIEKEKFPLSIIRINDYDFIDALTQKMHWGFDVRNK